MLTFEDCIALCGLSEEEVAAIAEHEHIPEIAALELGDYLIHTDNGELLIKKMIIDDIEHSRASGNIKHAADPAKTALEIMAVFQGNSSLWSKSNLSP